MIINKIGLGLVVLLLFGFVYLNVSDKKVDYINSEGKIVKDRFFLPKGFERLEANKETFGNYLQTLKLKEVGEKVRLFDGRINTDYESYVSVIDIDVGNRDLQHCADAVMRLRAEYLYSKKEYDKIAFNFTNGFKFDYSRWTKGYRIKVLNNKVEYTKKVAADFSYETFRKYLNIVFAYSGTMSLKNELIKKDIKNINIGDVFIIGGYPGHAVIVVDLAINKETGEKIFLLAQSLMPAQDIHILQNVNNDKLSPWYSNNFDGAVIIAGWDFYKTDLRKFNEIN